MNADGGRQFAFRKSYQEFDARNAGGSNPWPSAGTLTAYLVVFALLVYQLLPSGSRPPPGLQVLRKRMYNMLSPRLMMLWEQSYGSVNRALGHVSEGEPFGAIAPAAQTIKRAYGRLPGFRHASTAPRSSTVQDGAPPGLGNWDNSCYQNSVLQVFISFLGI